MVNQGQPHLRIIRKGMLAFFVFITGKYRNISGKNRWLHSCGLFLSSFLFFSGFASAQQVVGVVTALKGQAQLTRAATQGPRQQQRNADPTRNPTPSSSRNITPGGPSVAYQEAHDTYQVITGTPDTVIEKLKHAIDLIDPGYLILWGREGPMSHEVAMRSIDLMTQEVIPAIKEYQSKRVS